MRKIYCQKCEKEITSRKQLFTTQIFFWVAAYCSTCYVERIKSVSSLAVSNTPLNGKYSNFLAGITVIGLFMVFFAEIPYIKIPLIVVLSLVLLMRIYSYMRFERHLPVVDASSDINE
ncbi:hypothetical protein [Halalkalibacillus halophilus]|uniref:hypothetical protein n=1 Tax=Halalkalibacillus halophilus TaxID=392827 RepID=UPI000487FA90|nr:hypothetical protein [Halalkalibacillus halophilus]